MPTAARLARKPEKRSFEVVTFLIMTVCEGYANQKAVDELRTHSGNHAEDCALGSTPACTCGQREAKHFLELFDGKVRGPELIR